MKGFFKDGPDRALSPQRAEGNHPGRKDATRLRPG